MYFRSRTFLKDEEDDYYYRDGDFDYYINENYHVLDRDHNSPVSINIWSFHATIDLLKLTPYDSSNVVKTYMVSISTTSLMLRIALTPNQELPKLMIQWKRKMMLKRKRQIQISWSI